MERNEIARSLRQLISDAETAGSAAARGIDNLRAWSAGKTKEAAALREGITRIADALETEEHRPDDAD